MLDSALTSSRSLPCLRASGLQVETTCYMYMYAQKKQMGQSVKKAQQKKAQQKACTDLEHGSKTGRSGDDDQR